MNKFFRLFAGKRWYCDEKGMLLKDENDEYREVPEDADDENLEEVEIDDDADASEEAKAALRAAAKQAKRDAEVDLEAASVKASDAVKKMLDSIAEGTEKYTKIKDGSDEEPEYMENVRAGLKQLSEKQRNSFSFEVKSAKDLKYFAKATSESGSLTDDVIEGDRVTEITRDPVRSVFVESIADVTSNMTSDHLSYVEATNESGAPLPTAELAASSEKDFDFQEFKAYLKKITVTNKHSEEILQDAPQLVSAIRGWLQEDVNIVTDDQLLNGNGTGENLDGVFNVASVLDAAAVGTKEVANPNLYDVIRVALTKIATSGKGKFAATHVLLNPEDSDELDLTKDANGQYILPPFRSADGTQIKGARVIENTGVPAGEFLVGDFRRLHIGTKGGVQITMTNSDGTDFTKGILTVRLIRRVASYVRTNDNGAFWTGDIADVKGYLTPAS